MVEILDETNRFPAADRVAMALQALMDELGVGHAEVTVVLLPDDEIQRLNAEHRGEDEPTDVLSYPTHEPDDVGMPSVPHLGDVLIALGVATRQAQDHGRSVTEEVAVLAAHGLTHLRGFDHTDQQAWEPFHASQERVVELLEGPSQ